MPDAGVQTVFDRVGGPDMSGDTRADQLTVKERTLVPDAGAGVFACPEFEGWVREDGAPAPPRSAPSRRRRA